MKRYVSVLVALVCVLSLSVISFAAGSAIPISSFSQLLDDKGSYLDIKQVIPASEFDSKALTSWNRFTSSLGGSSTYLPFIFVDSKTLPCTYGFLCFDSTKAVSVSNNGYFAYSSGAGSFDYLTVSFDASGNFTSYNLESNIVNFLRYSGKTLLWGHGSLNNYASDLDYVNRGSKLVQVSDDLNSPEEPEEPEEPSSSSEPDESIPDTPKPPPYNPAEPTIPAGNEYVLYDTGIWNTVIAHIKKNIGSAANVGLLVFGFILIWSIMRRIFHHFTRL